MHIEVKDCPDVHFVQLIEKSIEYYAERLIPDKRTRNGVTIYVTFEKDLNVEAHCSIHDYNSRKKPRLFDIEMNSNLGSRRILSTLAHEMVHIKQYIAGELNETMTAWKGKRIDPDSLDYYDHPWEIEAYGKEQGLLSGLVTKYKLYDILSDLNNPDAAIEFRPIAWKTNEREIR